LYNILKMSTKDEAIKYYYDTQFTQNSSEQSVNMKSSQGSVGFISPGNPPIDRVAATSNVLSGFTDNNLFNYSSDEKAVSSQESGKRMDTGSNDDNYEPNYNDGEELDLSLYLPHNNNHIEGIIITK
jgi:hypothetical protein